jgi:undecaprenyl-diphosphatase
LRRDWRATVLLLAITLSGRALIDWQKVWTNGVRPEEQVHLIQVQSLTFPSTHAANATLVWLCLALLIPRAQRSRTILLWAAVWLVLAIGVSQSVLGLHWPTDVIGGWAFGLFWTMLLLGLSGHSLDEGTSGNSAHVHPSGRD